MGCLFDGTVAAYFWLRPPKILWRFHDPLFGHTNLREPSNALRKAAPAAGQAQAGDRSRGGGSTAENWFNVPPTSPEKASVIPRSFDLTILPG